jgi:hypothetical protein
MVTPLPQVVTGQFSWVDALGTRHVTVYRADESGYHVLEMREEVGAVQIDPDRQPRRFFPDRENRVAIANSRGAKLFERNRSFQVFSSSLFVAHSSKKLGRYINKNNLQHFYKIVQIIGTVEKSVLTSERRKTGSKSQQFSKATDYKN